MYEMIHYLQKTKKERYYICILVQYLIKLCVFLCVVQFEKRK